MVRHDGPEVKKKHEGPAHAKYSASGSPRWLACAGSIALSEKAPPSVDSIYSIEGTTAHSCLEYLLKNRKNLEAATKIAAKTYSEEMIAHALDAIAWIRHRMTDAPLAWLLCETRVDASPFTCADQFGTLDAAIVDEFRTLVVIDYKYGAGVAVDPEGYDGRGNAQLVYYALGISHEYHHNFKDVELVVIQPRAFHQSGNTTRTHRMSMDELLAWVPIFLAGVTASQHPKAPLKSGAWCKFCPAAVLCPELKDEALKRAKIDFSDTTGIESVPSPKLVPVKNLSVMLDACDQLDAWIEALRDHAFSKLAQGEKIPGYKLVDKQGRRKWKDDGFLYAEATTLFGEAALAPPKLLTPAQLEKQKPRLKGDHVKEFFKRYTVKESSGVTMVKDSDKRASSTGGNRRNDFEPIITIDVTPKKGKKK